MRFVSALAALALGATAAAAQDVEGFYRGKTVRIIVGFSAGGGYDHYARVLSRHIGRHIPGQPNVIVQNMPGAASLNSVRYVATAAPTDGTVINAFNPGPDHAVGDGAAEDRREFSGLRLARQRHRGFPRLPHLERHRHQGLAGPAQAPAGEFRRHRRRHRVLHRLEDAERPVRRRCPAGDRLSRLDREAHRDRARRARRRLHRLDQRAGAVGAREEGHGAPAVLAHAGRRHAGDLAGGARRAHRSTASARSSIC